MSKATEIPRTQACGYCYGTGVCPATGGNCLTCHGEAVLCILCRLPPSVCECPQERREARGEG